MLLRRSHTPGSFWRWFQRDPRLGTLSGEGLCARVGRELTRYHPGLVCEVGPPEQDPRELIISADGIRANVDAVEALADAAPPLPGWKITRFRPPSDNFASVHVIFGDVTAIPSEVRFVATRDGPHVDLCIYAPWREDDGHTGADGPTFILLDHALGEYNVICAVGAIDVFPASHAPPEARPWSEIRRAFREFQG